MNDPQTDGTPHPLALGRRWMVTHVVVFALALMTAGALFFGMPRVEASELERRNLATFPTFNPEALAAGTYTQAIDLYVADHFPFREEMVELAFWLRDHRGLGQGGLLEDRAGAGDDSARRTTQDPVSVPVAEAAPAPRAAPSARRDAAPAKEEATAPDDPLGPGRPPGVSSQGQLKKKEGLLIVDGQAMHPFTGNDEDTTRYAGVVSDYAKILGDAVAVYAVIVPSAAAFYLPEAYRRHSRDELAYISKTYGKLASGARGVLAYEALSLHTSEYLYFRTDHHWTALGAYYTYVAFAKEAGLTPRPLADFERKVRDDHYLGTWFGRTRAPELKKSPDRVDYYASAVDYTAVKYRKSNPDRAVATKFLDEKAPNYGVFLGGDYPLMIAKTSQGGGRRVLVVKNSYGNPFAVWLLSHFEEVLVLDYRYFKGDILDVIEDHKVTDLVFINGILTSSTQVHTSLMRRLKKRRRKP
jgi:hypothetical protein